MGEEHRDPNRNYLKKEDVESLDLETGDEIRFVISTEAQDDVNRGDIQETRNVYFVSLEEGPSYDYIKYAHSKLGKKVLNEGNSCMLPIIDSIEVRRRSKGLRKELVDLIEKRDHEEERAKTNLFLGVGSLAAPLITAAGLKMYARSAMDSYSMPELPNLPEESLAEQSEDGLSTLSIDREIFRKFKEDLEFYRSNERMNSEILELTRDAMYGYPGEGLTINPQSLAEVGMYGLLAFGVKALYHATRHSRLRKKVYEMAPNSKVEIKKSQNKPSH